MRRREVRFSLEEWAAMENVAGAGFGDVSRWVHSVTRKAVGEQADRLRIAALEADVRALQNPADHPAWMTGRSIGALTLTERQLTEDQQTDAYFEAQEAEEAALAACEAASDRAYANRDDRAEQPDDARDEAIRLRRSM